MTQRGERTRARLIDATLAVVGEVGYARASTRAIADAAGVAEGTIYRHFPDKASLFFAAALAPSAAVLDWVGRLPALAGTSTVEENLTEALTRLAELQERVLPLELAILGDPELSAQRRRSLGAETGPPGAGPQAIAAYLQAEQALGRVKADVNPADVALLVLAVLFGLGMTVATPGGRIQPQRLQAAVATLVNGFGADRT